MAELYIFKKCVGDVSFACYSERGLVAYYMLRVLPTDPKNLLRQIQNGAGECPFSSIEVANLTIFSELAFGNRGFGSPDGALFFKVSGHPYMIFYEAKLNETYLQSCSKSRSDKSRYNSTIKGQLELKWRLLTSYKSDSIIVGRDGVEYVEESEKSAVSYSEPDAPIANRRLILKAGVGEVFQNYVSSCDINDVYFLISTKDQNNPFTNPDVRPEMPRCGDKTWDETKRQFCWVSNSVFENCPRVETDS